MHRWAGSSSHLCCSPSLPASLQAAGLVAGCTQAVLRASSAITEGHEPLACCHGNEAGQGERGVPGTPQHLLRRFRLLGDPCRSSGGHQTPRPAIGKKVSAPWRRCGDGDVGSQGCYPRVYGCITTYWSVSDLRRAARRADPRFTPWRLVPNVRTMSGQCCAVLAAAAFAAPPMLHESSLNAPKSTT